MVAANEDGRERPSKYTLIAPTLLYTPKGPKPDVSELYDDRRYRAILAGIEASKVPEELKEFLRLAAARHVAIDFEKVAEFYAHSDAEVRRLFEDQVLVIVDYGKALERGFLKLTKRLTHLCAEEHPEA
jgi:hypothetical protein